MEWIRGQGRPPAAPAMRASLVLTAVFLACALLAIAAWTWMRPAPPPPASGSRPLGEPAATVRLAATSPAVETEAPPASETDAPAATTEAAQELAKERAPAPTAERAASILHGRVVDPRGRAVEGADVLLAERSASWPWPLTPERALEARSGSEGRFQFDLVPPGDLRLCVRHAAFAPLELEELWQPPSGTTDVGTLALAPGLVITGRVLAPDGSGLAGARISAMGGELPRDLADYNELAGTLLGTSGEGGEFRVTTRRGAWNLLVSTAGPFASDGTAPAYPDKLFTGNSADDPEIVVELHLEAGFTIEGAVSEASTLPDELVVHALPALAWRYDDYGESELLPDTPYQRAGYRTALVQADGTFVLRGLAPGEPYRLRALPPDGRLEDADAFAEWTSARAGDRGVLLVYRAGITLELAVVDSSTGAPVDEFELRLGEMVTQHADGKAVLRDVRPRALNPEPLYEDVPEAGDIKLIVDAPWYDLQEVVAQRAMPGQHMNLGRVALVPLRVLPVRVFDVEDEALLEGAVVTLALSPPESDAPTKHRKSSVEVTNAKGQGYPTVPPALGPLALTIELPGYLRHEETVSSAVGCRAAEISTYPLHDVHLQRSKGALLVSVVDPAGVPVPGATVLTRKSGDWEIETLATTDANGQGVVRDLAPGPVLLRADSASRLLQSNPLDGLAWQTAQIVPGEDVRVTLLAERLEELVGNVYAGGRALDGAVLSLAIGRWRNREYLDLSGPEAMRTQRAGPNGDFRFERLLPGTYSLAIVHAASQISTGRTIDVAPGQGRIVIDVEDTGLAGTVRDSEGRPIERAEVFVFPSKWKRNRYQEEQVVVALGAVIPDPSLGHTPIARATSDSAGHWVVRGVPGDQHLVLVFQAERLSAVSDVSARQGELIDGLETVLVADGSLALAFPPPEHGGVQRLGLVGRRIDVLAGLPGITLAVDETPAAETFSLPAGNWRVRLFEIDAFERVARIGPHYDVDVEPGSERSITLRMP